jgi:HK97 family phage major capsid protein
VELLKKILELRQKRATLVNTGRELLDKAEKENRELSAEEDQQYEKIMADVDKMGKDIEREEKQASLEKDLNQITDRAHRPDPQAQDKQKVEPRAAKEYRDAFWKALSTGHNSLTADQVNLLMNPEIRNMAIGTDASGGYLVPDEFERQIIKELEAENVMRGLATVITTGSGTREIPVEADYGSATWLGENAAYTESEASFNQVTLTAFKLGTIVKVSEELLNDSAFNIDRYVASAFARRFARAEEAAFVNGDGAGKPDGLVGSSTQGKVGATGQTTSVTTDDLIDTYHGLKRPYRKNATWLLADSSAKIIRKLKDADGQYLWQPGLQAGQPDRILSRPAAISDDVPAMAASAKSILFGDISYYWIADRVGRTMQRLVELYAANGQVGFRMYERVDGKLILPEAVVHYQNSAS